MAEMLPSRAPALRQSLDRCQLPLKTPAAMLFAEYRALVRLLQWRGANVS
jgi:hypothetical protein